MGNGDYPLMDEGNYLHREIVPYNSTDKNRNKSVLFRVAGRGSFHLFYTD